AALDNIAALTADNSAGRAAPIEEEDCLLAALQRLVQGRAERLAEDAGVARAQLGTQVHQCYWGQVRRGRTRGAGRGALAQLDQSVDALGGAPVGLDRGGGAAQDDGGAG